MALSNKEQEKRIVVPYFKQFSSALRLPSRETCAAGACELEIGVLGTRPILQLLAIVGPSRAEDRIQCLISH